MKNSASQLLAQSTADNQEYIKESGLTAEDYFKNEFENNPEDFFCWMTEEEIESWENGDREEIRISFNDLF